MFTQGCDVPEIARQLTASESPLKKGNCVRSLSVDWVNDFTNLYNSTGEYANRDYAIISKLGEVYDYQTATEVKFLLDHVDGKVRQEYFDRFLKTCTLDEQSVVKIRSPSVGLEPRESGVTLLVKYIGHTEIKKRASGYFRVYMKKDGEEQQVIFNRRPACILYLIYLLDIYESKNTAKFDIANYETQFCDLHLRVYHYPGKADFMNLIGKGTSKQKLLRHNMRDMRQALGQTCALLQEDASLYIPDKYSNIRVQKKNIVIDQKFFDKKYWGRP